MSVQWIRRDHRQDMVLAVCLDAAANLLMRAKSDRQLEEAVSYNLRLWRIIREMARERPLWPDGDMLSHVADHVASLLALDACPCVDPRDMAFVAGRNMSLSCDLAGGGQPDHYRDRLVAEWAGSHSSARFETWMLERLTGAVAPV
ncbi:MAG TPA: hypothetical protein VK196_06185 [Magnetospirillum sp.]|nr:hypothetical protein [Magnetospirillum sp.]